jgi:hypothetical protein
MAIGPDDVVVLCSRVEDGPSGVPGSSKEFCCQCLRQVWLSPATRKTVEESNPEYKIVCLVCGEKRLRENPSADDQLMLPSPEQLKEILKNISELN